MDNRNNKKGRYLMQIYILSFSKFIFFTKKYLADKPARSKHMDKLKTKSTDSVARSRVSKSKRTITDALPNGMYKPTLPE